MTQLELHLSSFLQDSGRVVDGCEWEGGRVCGTQVIKKITKNEKKRILFSNNYDGGGDDDDDDDDDDVADPTENQKR